MFIKRSVKTPKFKLTNDIIRVDRFLRISTFLTLYLFSIFLTLYPKSLFLYVTNVVANLVTSLLLYFTANTSISSDVTIVVAHRTTTYLPVLTNKSVNGFGTFHAMSIPHFPPL